MFKTDLVVRRIIGVRNAWQLEKSLIWEEKVAERTSTTHFDNAQQPLGNPSEKVAERSRSIEVPKNFIFDFASVPKLFWQLFPKQGMRYDRASCLHDWLYVTEYFTRKECDKLFYKAMLSDNVAKWKAKTMYLAVRVGGYFVWKKHTKENIQKMRKSGGLKAWEN